MNRINKFREFSWLISDEKLGFADLPKQSENVGNPEERALLGLIYAPNAQGFPSTDLSYSLQADARPEVQDFIRRSFMTPIHSANVLGDTEADGDFCLECNARPDETLYDYAARLRSLVNSKKLN